MSSSLSPTFLYFGYASNLLAQRLQINITSAVRKTSAKLQDYRLDFNYYSDLWKGAMATIVPDEGEFVWGYVWEIASEQIQILDSQEGVNSGAFTAIDVSVLTKEGDKILCRCYKQIALPEKSPIKNFLPEKRRPSPFYHQIILQGAIQSHLPQEYIQKLKEIPHNNYQGSYAIEIKKIWSD